MGACVAIVTVDAASMFVVFSNWAGSTDILLGMHQREKKKQQPEHFSFKT